MARIPKDCCMFLRTQNSGMMAARNTVLPRFWSEGNYWPELRNNNMQHHL
jgi:hypothetical protein